MALKRIDYIKTEADIDREYGNQDVLQKYEDAQMRASDMTVGTADADLREAVLDDLQKARATSAEARQVFARLTEGESARTALRTVLGGGASKAVDHLLASLSPAQTVARARVASTAMTNIEHWTKEIVEQIDLLNERGGPDTVEEYLQVLGHVQKTIAERMLTALTLGRG
jgi:hypothetical protein